LTWAQAHDFQASQADRDVWVTAWTIAYALGKRDAYAYWLDDVSVVEERMKLNYEKRHKRGKNTAKQLDDGAGAACDADNKNEGREAPRIPDAEEQGMAGQEEEQDIALTRLDEMVLRDEA
jgi:hypothetical protein